MLVTKKQRNISRSLDDFGGIESDQSPQPRNKANIFGDIIDAVTGGLFGEEQQPSQQRSGFEAWPKEAQETYLDYLARGQGVADTTAPFAPASINPYEQTYLNMVSGVDRSAPALSDRGYGYFTPGEQAGAFDFGRRSSQQYRGAADTLAQAPGMFQLAAQAAGMGIDPITGEMITGTTDQFMNPYMGEVVGSTQSAMQDLLDRSQAAARARAGGALGNTRVGVEQGTIASEGAKRLGEVLGGLKYQGYSDAQNRAMEMLTGNRARALEGSGAYTGAGAGITQAGNTMGNLASQLMNARMGMSNLRSASQSRQMGAGQFMRGIETGQAQVPLAQLQLLQSLFAPLSGTSYNIGGTQPTQGVLSSGGNYMAGLGNMFGFM